MTLPTTARLPAGRHPGVASKLTSYTGEAGTYIDINGQLQTAAANVPRVEHSGVRETLLSGSYSLSNVGTGSPPVVVSATETAPDGSATAMRVQLDKGAGLTANDSSTLSFTFRPNIGTIVGTQCAGSVWMRTADNTTKLVRVDFNGITTTTGGPSVLTVTPVWQRFEFGFVTSIDTQRRMMIRLRGTVGSDDYADLMIWAPQQENFTLTPGAAQLPFGAARAQSWLGESSPTHNPGALVVEPATVQMMPNTQALHASPYLWSRATVTANNAVAPDGTTTATKYIWNNAAGGPYLYLSGSFLPDWEPATDYVLSVFLKPIGPGFIGALASTVQGGFTGLNMQFNLDDRSFTVSGTVGGLTPLADGWVRAWVRIRSSDVIPAKANWIFLADQTPLAGELGIWVWGVNVTKGSQLLSYMPNSGSTPVARAADAAVIALP